MKLSLIAKKRIIAGLAALLVLAGVYQYNQMATEKKIKPVKVVFASQDIPPHTKITEDMLFERVVPGDAIPPNAIRNKQNIVGKWTVDGFGIAKNSLIYKGKILTTDEMPDAAQLNLKEGEYGFPLLVDLETSSGNSIKPHTHVDLWFATEETETRQPLTGLLFKDVRVTAVKDSKTRNVFSSEDYVESKKQQSQSAIATSTSEPKAIAKLYTFAVTKEQYKVLNKAKMLGNIIPVLKGSSAKEINEKIQKVTTTEKSQWKDINEDIKNEEYKNNSKLLTWINKNTYNIATTEINNQNIKEN